MFPLVHHYSNKQVFGHANVDNSLILGGLFPDLAINTGLSRNTAHTCGPAFYEWHQLHQCKHLNFIKGILTHNTLPEGLDYYSDEFWPGGEKGYCFQQGRSWMKEVEKATGLPQKLIWWKSHNFVEMAFELIAYQRDPFLGLQILEAIGDHQTIEEVSTMVSDFFRIDKKKMIEAYEMVPKIFALSEVTPQTLAEKQCRSFQTRHNCHNGNIEEMSHLLEEMTCYFDDKFDPFMQTTTHLIKNMLSSLCEKHQES
ncbi:MAG: hypothetical protein ACOX05_03380 [Bacillota bacterium]|jgi:hypothetical protein